MLIFFLSLVGKSPKSILDVACGSGRYLVSVAKAGHKVMGLDFDKFDKNTNICTFVRRYEITLENGREIVKDIPNRKYFVPLTKVQRWLLNVGFVIEGIGGDYEKNPIGVETDRAIIWARKVLY